MFKIIVFICFFALQQNSYACECNYNKLRTETDNYSGRIIEQIPTSIDKIKNDLTFLSPNHKITPEMDKYNKTNFEKLCLESKKLDLSHEFLQEFIQNCSYIFDSSNEDFLIQQSVYMLLQRVSQELEEYFNSVRQRQQILTKFRPIQNVTKDPSPSEHGASKSADNIAKNNIVIYSPTHVEHERFNQYFVTEVK
jgi:hypothetical protein